MTWEMVEPASSSRCSSAKEVPSQYYILTVEPVKLSECTMYPLNNGHLYKQCKYTQTHKILLYHLNRGLPVGRKKDVFLLFSIGLYWILTDYLLACNFNSTVSPCSLAHFYFFFDIISQSSVVPSSASSCISCQVSQEPSVSSFMKWR